MKNSLTGLFVVVFVVFWAFSCNLLVAADRSVVQKVIPPSTIWTLIHRLEHPAAHDVMVVAHRACWRLAPENSIAAIKECIRIGVDVIEIDVRRTKDNHLVVIHDSSVDRTTNGTGDVSKLTLNELRALVLKENSGGEGASLTDQKIPTLEEALMVAKGRILINLDAKAKVRKKAIYLAHKTGTLRQIIMKMSTHSPFSSKLRKSGILGRSFFMPIIHDEGEALSKIASRFDRLGPVAYEVIYKTEDFLMEGVAIVAAQRARLWVNTMWDRLSPGHSDAEAIKDPDAHWGYLISLGVNMIQTDRPQVLIDYLAQRKNITRKE